MLPRLKPIFYALFQKNCTKKSHRNFLHLPKFQLIIASIQKPSSSITDHFRNILSLIYNNILIINSCQEILIGANSFKRR